MNHKIDHLGIAKLPKNVLSQFWICKYFEFFFAVQLPFSGVDGNKDDLKGGIWGKHIQGSWKRSSEALTDIIAPILNCIFAEAVILWVRHPELLERYQNPISMYVFASWLLFLTQAPVSRLPLTFRPLHCSLGDLSGTETQAGQNSNTLGSYCLQK